ncbi:MAG: hypothetical protein RR898_00975 [Clostridium sp.]|uniref:hypothetical protein n=1 Tax=Clostridium sp. TaxID=1506 RepID=UPI002FCA39E1
MFLISKIREIYIKSPSTYRNICYILSILFRHTYAFIIAATALLAYLIYYFTLRIDQSIYTVSIVGVIYLIMIYYLFRVVFIRRYTLKGIYLDRDNYKSLWEIVDSLVEEYKGPKIENIILTKKTNIKVILHKSKGIRGRYINSLEIGLPIVLGFSEKELKDSIALSVISASKIRNIKHRSYTKTLKLMESLFRDDALYSKSNVAVKNMILPVYKYIYNFYKEIISVALGEAKLESDKMYIETFGSKVLINTILKKKVHSYLVAEVFDRAIEKEIEETEEAIGNYYTKMSTYLNELVSGRDITICLKNIKGEDRESLDFKRSLIARIENANEDIDNFQYEFGNNSIRFLSKNFSKIEARYNKIWQAEKKKGLRIILQRNKEEKQVYANLSKEFNEFKLKESSFPLYLSLREKYTGINNAIIEGKKLCIGYPNNPSIRLLVGKMLLDGNNPQGIEYIESAIRINPFVSYEGYREIINFYRKKDAYNMVDRYTKEYKELRDRCKVALKERERPSFNLEKYIKLDLEPDQIISIKKELQNLKILKYAYLSKLNVESFSEIPQYILWTKYKVNFFTMEETLRNIDSDIKRLMPIQNVTVIHLNGDNFFLHLLIKKIKKCKIIRKR